jgi:DNA-binding FadR family transcriptional regulator
MESDKDINEKIKEHLLKKGYGPGERIETENTLAQMFKVSRHSIRKVLDAMMHQGVLVKYPRRGTFIKDLDTKTIGDNLRFSYEISRYNIYEYIEARIVIEVAVLPLVVRRITPNDIAELQETINRMFRYKDTPKRADKADRDFHFKLLKACGNGLLASFSNLISQLFSASEYRRKYWKPNIIEKLAKDHQLILDAITIGDLELAVQRHKDHFHYKQKIEHKNNQS